MQLLGTCKLGKGWDCLLQTLVETCSVGTPSVGRLLGGPITDGGYPKPVPIAPQHPRALHPLQTKFLSSGDGFAGFS